MAKKKATTSKPTAEKATGRAAGKKAVAKKTAAKKATKKVAKKAVGKAVAKKPATGKVAKKTTKGPAKGTAKKVSKAVVKKAPKKSAKKASKKVSKKSVTTASAVREAAHDVVDAAKAVARAAGDKAERLGRQARDPKAQSSVKKKTKKVLRKATSAVSDAAQRVSEAADSARSKSAGTGEQKKAKKKKMVRQAAAATEASSGESVAKPVRRKVVRRIVTSPGVSEPGGDAREEDRPTAGRAAAFDAGAESGEPSRRKRKRRRGRGRGEAAESTQTEASPSTPRDQPAGGEADVPRSKRRRSTAAPEPGELDRWDEIFEKQTFADLGLRSSVLKGIEACGFKYPTKIQSQLIPLMIAGEDVLGQSRTGTGKTAAFGLPLFHNAEKGKPYQTIILAPTRELAIQIGDELRDLGRFTPIKVGVVYGGQKMNQQQKALEAGPEIIVATPGRLMDVNQRGWLHFHDVKTVVLDEVDRMLDIGFRDDIREILSRMRGEHQTVLVSATISEEIERLARKFMRKDVKRLETVGTSLTVSLVQQHYVSVMPWDKMRMLHHLLTHEEPTMTLVFCNMKRTVDKVTQFLRRKGLDAEAIHGDLPQGMRNAIMRKLHDGKLHMLICSDLAARGLDVEGVSHVVNYDLPEDPEVYIHRVGRTARAGRDGVAWALVTPADGHLLTQIEMLANIHIPEKKMPGFEPGPEPEHIVADRAAQERRLEQVRTAKNRFASSTQNAASLSKAAVSSGRANPFPTGPIPTKLPPRKLGGKIKTARSMKESTPPGLGGGEQN